MCDLDIRTGARFTGIRNKAMLLLFIDSGLRRAEMVNLRLSNLDLESRRVRVVGKGNKIGIAPFCPKTAKSLRAWLTSGTGGNPHPFNPLSLKIPAALRRLLSGVGATNSQGFQTDN